MHKLLVCDLYVSKISCFSIFIISIWLSFSELFNLRSNKFFSSVFIFEFYNFSISTIFDSNSFIYLTFYSIFVSSIFFFNSLILFFYSFSLSIMNFSNPKIISHLFDISNFIFSFFVSHNFNWSKYNFSLLFIVFCKIWISSFF